MTEAVSPKRLVFDVLLFLLAEQTEAFLLLLLFVLLPLPGTRLGGERDGGRQCLSAPRHWRARVAALDVGSVDAGIQDGLDPGAHLLLQGATQYSYPSTVVKYNSEVPVLQDFCFLLLYTPTERSTGLYTALHYSDNFRLLIQNMINNQC